MQGTVDEGGSSQRQPRLLVVEDHDLVRRLTVTMLEKANFQVLSAASGREALELLAGSVEVVDCALIDLTMPGISGQDLAAAIKAQRPQQPIIMMSAYNEHMAAEQMAEQLDLTRFLQKPFTAEALVAAVQAALASQPPIPRA